MNKYAHEHTCTHAPSCSRARALLLALPTLGLKLVSGQLRVEKPPWVTVALKSAAVTFGTKSCPTGGELSDGPEFRQKILSSRLQQHLHPKGNFKFPELINSAGVSPAHEDTFYIYEY